ncbi:ThiF family adenylyltransferase [Agrococcus jejuensis]|uniref:Adenylyltransferase and sulfurtransferase n=1 Tax=Agrococcus jejuensis TaxID=399736 RepID=A0A1G8GRV0_9MICO|nr:ThiF family adenylyltransferase [Agrococcus jejuensis]SDH97089.1 adenylyltransferase and sulfurtransferase [Agrococcus jejuensis]
MPFPPLVEPVEHLSAEEQLRTARHAVLAGFGEVGQRRLAAAHVAVVGAGGLGSPVVLALAAAGVGTITILDDDVVEASNLQRQVLHRLADVGRPKVDSAVRAAADLSPETRVEAVRRRVDADSAATLLAGADVVVDGTDTFATRAAVAAACERLGVPLVWGVVQEFHAQVTVLWSAPPVDASPVTLADLYPPDTVGEVPTCAQVGVLGALCLQVGGLMALEAVKLVTGIGEPLLGRVAVIDALRARQTEVPLRAAGATPAATPTTPAPVPHLTPADAATARAAGATILDVREPHETAAGSIPGSVLLPLDTLLADPAAVGDGPVVVVCQRGARALQAARALRDLGVEASVLAGGIEALRPDDALRPEEDPA